MAYSLANIRTAASYGLIQLTLVATLAAELGCRGEAGVGRTADPPTARVENLRALTRLYGVIRWFHPSDASAAINWDRFAIEAARQVIDAPDPLVLHATLARLFAPIAPSVHIARPGEALRVSPLPLPSTENLDIVAWQHKGYGDSTLNAGYASKRRHRDRMVAVSGAPFVALSQSIDAVPHRGSRVRLRGKLRAGNHGQGHLWLRVDRGDEVGFFDNMDNRPVISELWTHAEIIGTIAPDATRIIFGGLVIEAGTVWYDDLELAIEANNGTWKLAAIQDSGFETPDPLQTWRPGLGRGTSGTSTTGWSITADRVHPASGASSLRIEQTKTVVTEELFDAIPEPGEAVNVDLGSGLRARVPIAIYSANGRTIGDSTDAARRTQLSPPTTSQSFDAISAVADVIVVWNVLAHFWPYWNTVSIDWHAELDKALADALDDRSIAEHVETLERLTAAAPDGHARTNCPGESASAYLPFAVDLVEDKIVVTTSIDKAVHRGDVLLGIDSRLASHVLAEQVALSSGSPQWRTVRGLARLGLGSMGTVAELRLQRGDIELTASVARIDHDVSEAPLRSAIERLDDGFYYIDLARAEMPDIERVMDRLASAPGIVFDVRSRPNSNHEVLSHLVTQLDATSAWEAIPLIVRPYSASTPVSWEETSSWNMPLLNIKQPRISGRIAFLSGPRAISYAESVLALISHYRLGEIVGSATAGTNGDIAQIGEPTGCRTVFTGRRVTNHDGSQFHLIGVLPTIPASRTVAGVRDGRDEILDSALGYLRSRPK